MQFEVEQKYRVDDLAAVEGRLANLGAICTGEVEQVDQYFAHPTREFATTDEALRIRSVGQRNFVTYKGPKFDAATKTRHEAEVRFADGQVSRDACEEIFMRLGFTPVAEVRKRRQIWRGDEAASPVEFALDDVTGVGQFVEIELLCPSDASGNPSKQEFETAQAAIADLAQQLGLREIERRSYLELLLSLRPGP